MLEEIEKLNNSTKQNNKNTTNDKDTDKLSNQVKNLEKQKNEIYAAFKKSLKLCSILKRQKIH